MDEPRHTVDRFKYEVEIARMTRRVCDGLLEVRDAETAGEITHEQAARFLDRLPQLFDAVKGEVLPDRYDRPRPTIEPGPATYGDLVVAFSAFSALRKRVSHIEACGRLTKTDADTITQRTLECAHTLAQALGEPEFLPERFACVERGFFRIQEIAGLLRAECRHGRLDASKVAGVVRVADRFAETIKSILQRIDERTP